jgi:hypothetical protein
VLTVNNVLKTFSALNEHDDSSPYPPSPILDPILNATNPTHSHILIYCSMLVLSSQLRLRYESIFNSLWFHNEYSVCFSHFLYACWISYLSYDVTAENRNSGARVRRPLLSKGRGITFPLQRIAANKSLPGNKFPVTTNRTTEDN